MKVIDKEMLSQLVGGLEVDGGGAGDGSGGSGEVPGGGTPGGGAWGIGGHAYDLGAISVEGGQIGVVRVSGAIPVFENAPPNVSVGQEPAAWEGSLVGIYADPTLSVQHMAVDSILSGVVYSEASAFGEAALAKALQNSGLAAKLPGPLKIAGIAIGVGTAYGSLILMERDHPKNDNKGYIDKDGVRHLPRAMTPDDDEGTYFTGPAGGAVMRMVA